MGAALARRPPVLALDLSGFGQTPLAGRSTRREAQRALVARFLDEVIGAPAIVVGNSMGGLIAMMHAAAEPIACRISCSRCPRSPDRRGAASRSRCCGHSCSTP